MVETRVGTETEAVVVTSVASQVAAVFHIVAQSRDTAAVVDAVVELRLGLGRLFESLHC